jgi:hypothetical protein
LQEVLVIFGNVLGHLVLCLDPTLVRQGFVVGTFAFARAHGVLALEKWRMSRATWGTGAFVGSRGRARAGGKETIAKRIRVAIRVGV